MKITGSSAPAAVSSVTTPAAAPSSASAAPAAAAELESSVLQPAVQAMRSLPDFDSARVAELRDALAKGTLPFNAGRLAGLIERFHGGHE